MEMTTCSSCRYSANPVSGDKERLECHRHAPLALIGGGDDPTHWVLGGRSCGLTPLSRRYGFCPYFVHV